MTVTGEPLKVSDKLVQLHPRAAVNITVLTELKFIHEQKAGLNVLAISALIRMLISNAGASTSRNPKGVHGL
jgi:hypothetical protein